MTTSESQAPDGPARSAGAAGLRTSVRTRLLLAFLAIAGFSVLAAAAAIYAFREVGERLEVVGTRIPSAVSALELSRSAERIIATAPALLAAPDRVRRDDVKRTLAAEVERLRAKLGDMKGEGPGSRLHEDIETIVSSMTAELATLEELVARRLEVGERIAGLRRDVFRLSEEIQRLLAPWLEIIEGEIAALIGARGAPRAGAGDLSRLDGLIEQQKLLQSVQAKVAAAADVLTETSTAEQANRLPVLTFRFHLALRDLEGSTEAMDPKLRRLFLERLQGLRSFAEGPDAIAELRKRELDLLQEGQNLLAVIDDLSRQLVAAVDRLGTEAKREVGDAVDDALSVQRLSARALVAVAVLSLVSSLLIVWLYVGRNIVRRLAALSEGMLAIAGGRVDAFVPAEGSDEIGAMSRAVEVFRRNTLERDRLLAEKAQAAESLEREVEERTAELARSVEELRALGEVSRAVSSSVDLETVLATVLAKAVQLSDAEAGAIYVCDDQGGPLRLRATCGIGEAITEDGQEQAFPLGEKELAETVERGIPIQIPDRRSGLPHDAPKAAVDGSVRAVLVVPLRGPGRVAGALVVRRRRPGPFPDPTVELLQTFAAQSVLAIRNASLFAQVEQKSRQLETANRYKSHFLAAASHDLRQPLHALNLFVAQLRVDSDPETRARLVGRISAAVNAMNELFDALLDMTKLDSGLIQPAVSDFPVASLLSRVETTFGESAREKGLRLTIVMSAAWVRSDFVLLERILLNLVSNALRYTIRGGVLVGVRRRGRGLRIDVCDSGVGIPEARQREIFGDRLPGIDSDQRTGAARQRHGGMGLGLAIVNRLARLLDHPIEVHSQVGRGSRFSVLVPLASPRSEAEEDGRALAAMVDPARGKVVVVIDDDELVLDGMAGLLSSWGCEVVTAESADTALAALRARRLEPDLIVSDYHLAKNESENGIDAIERLHAAVNHDIPAFLISGDTTTDVASKIRAHGYRLLLKPIAPMRLRAMVNRFLAAPDNVNAPDP